MKKMNEKKRKLWKQKSPKTCSIENKFQMPKEIKKKNQSNESEIKANNKEKSFDTKTDIKSATKILTYVVAC